jgi:hypothetical protein
MKGSQDKIDTAGKMSNLTLLKISRESNLQQRPSSIGLKRRWFDSVKTISAKRALIRRKRPRFGSATETREIGRDFQGV